MPRFLGASKRCNSLRLRNPSEASKHKTYFVTLDTYKGIPFFGDLSLAKQVLSALLTESARRRAALDAYCVMTDHLHFLTSVDESTLLGFINAFKSYTTHLLWKRAAEIRAGHPIERPLPGSPGRHSDSLLLLPALGQGRLAIRPECVFLKNFECPSPGDFLNKHLWQRSYFDHICRNTNDYWNVVDYIDDNPVKRGYVARREFYPFRGRFGVVL